MSDQQRPPALEQSFELTFSAPPADETVPTHTEAAARRPASSAWVLSIVGGMFGLFVIVVIAIFAIIQLR